jgi:hypothetical protein
MRRLPDIYGDDWLPEDNEDNDGSFSEDYDSSFRDENDRSYEEYCR